MPSNIEVYKLSSQVLYGKKSKFTISNILITTLFILLIVSSLNNIASDIGFIGLVSLMIVLTITIFLFVVHLSNTKAILKTHFKLIVVSALFVGILFIGLLNNLTTRGIITFFQFLLMFGFMISLSTIKWNPSKIRSVGIITSFFVIFNFVVWAYTSFEPLFESIYGSSNMVGVYMLYSLFFIIWAKQHSKRKVFYSLIALLSLLVMYGSDTRSAMIALVTATGTYYIWGFISKRRTRFISFILVVFSLLISFVFLYPNLPKWKHFNLAETYMLEYTGKSLMSGRDGLWNVLISKISEKPLMGYGTGIQPNDVSSISQSSHNLYLQIALQNGYLGLITFLLLMIAIWLLFWKARKVKTVKLVAAFFIATLVYQSFEITFTQNLLSIGLIQWFIISIGISYYLFRNKTTPETSG